MSSALVHQLDSLGLWRQDLAEQCLSLRQFLRDHSVLDDSCGEWLDSLRRRLDSEKLRVAFVAEFSRGKSELINALFFASLGRRVMPATGPMDFTPLVVLLALQFVLAPLLGC